MQTKQPGDWSEADVTRFWDYHSTRDHRLSLYFSKQVGESIVDLLDLAGVLRGRVLDYGTGPGFLLERLLARGVDCWGCDTSPRSVERVNTQFAGRRNWHGAKLITGLPSELDAGQFDMVTCLETVEHLPTDLIQPVLQDVRRLLAPGGSALFTTPDAEDLQTGMIYCPFCDSEFHHVQHFQSFTAARLSEELTKAGFQVQFCQSMEIGWFQRRKQLPFWCREAIRSVLRATWRLFTFGGRNATIAEKVAAESNPGSNLVALVTVAGSRGDGPAGASAAAGTSVLK